jgi:hypothetical protein
MSEKRDELMRIVGQLQAATQLVEMVNVKTGPLRALVEVAGTTLNKAMLEAWAQAERPASEEAKHG